MDSFVKKTNYREVLEKEGVIYYINKGTSMLPLLHENKDIIKIVKTEKYKKGDAVLFIRSSGQYVLHRIKKIKGENYYIIGDNCLSGEYVKRENILGLLESVKSGKKQIINTSFIYKMYVFYVPIRRLKLKFRNFVHRVKIKLFNK